jgi:sorbitol/mannitol transport system permease protein
MRMTAIDRSAVSARTAAAPRPRSAQRPWMLRPAIIYLILVTQIPFLLTLYYSTTNWNLLRPERTRSVGLDNYVTAFQNPDFLAILGNTLVLSVAVVVLTLIFGMLFALLLNRAFLGRNVARTLLITPFLIMPVVTAVLWKDVLLNPAFGLIPQAVNVFGLGGADPLAQYAMASLIAIVCWEWTPFMMLILLAGLQSVPKEPLEAAQIDGAGPAGTFRFILLPFLARYIEIAVLLETLFVLSIFGEIFVVTSGGPGIATTTLTYDIFLEAFQRWNVGRASALGVIAVILANILVMIFLRVVRHESREREAR